MLVHESGLLPYAHLNLRRNPFGELSEEERTALALVDIDSVWEKLNSPNYVVQFIGEKGFGKTTHLLALRTRFASAGYVHIPEGERAAIPTGCPILIDEAQRLTLWQRIRLFRKHVPLVLGTHRDFTSELNRAGRAVETIHVERDTNAERLHQLLNARIDWVRRGDGAIPIVTLKTAETMLAEFGSDIRRIIHELYVTFQNLEKVSQV